jgi:hypothetical protein
VDPPDTVVEGIGKIDIAMNIKRDIEGHIEPRSSRRATIAAVAGLSSARDGPDRLIGPEERQQNQAFR